MDEILRDTIFNRLRLWMLEAGREIRRTIDNPRVIDTKTNRKDLVTEMDRQIEEFFTNRIRRFYPGHKLLTEEGYGDMPKTSDGTMWIIDPIDGTMNFVHQKKNFAISIGVYHDGVGEIGFIYDVMNNNLYSAIRGNGAYKNDRRLDELENDKPLSEAIVCLNHRWLCENRLVDEKILQQLVRDALGTRAYGSAALEFAFLAEGAIDAYISMHLEPWDIAAGKIIVDEVGGLTFNFKGHDIKPLQRTEVVTCNPKLKHILLESYLKRAKK